MPKMYCVCTVCHASSGGVEPHETIPSSPVHVDQPGGSEAGDADGGDADGDALHSNLRLNPFVTQHSPLEKLVGMPLATFAGVPLHVGALS
jgi:hypothetical protein